MSLTATYRSASDVNTAMAGVYKHMFLAVLNSMVVSYLVSGNAALMALLFGTALKWVVIFAPLVAILIFAFSVEKLSTSAMLLFLHGFAALMGLSMATIFVVYTMGSIVSAFMGAAVLFGTMSLYGYFTQRDLSGLGSLLFVGLIAIIIASVINVFVGSTLAQMVISAIAIIVFLGLTAYDTQKIREAVTYSTDGRAEIMGALTLYLDFINLFIHLLSLFGAKKD
jgi:FtsH-binding integral membrane protein